MRFASRSAFQDTAPSGWVLWRGMPNALVRVCIGTLV